MEEARRIRVPAEEVRGARLVLTVERARALPARALDQRERARPRRGRHQPIEIPLAEQRALERGGALPLAERDALALERLGERGDARAHPAGIRSDQRRRRRSIATAI